MARKSHLLTAAVIAWTNAATAADDAPICPDRPSKATGTCTVPAGRWPIETGLIDWTHDGSAGVTSDVTIIASSLIKYGVNDRLDLELGITPLQLLRVHGNGERA